jgi:uncharacterized glyoxalase superfamily protein PhnB
MTTMRKCTAVLVVDAVEPSLAFWKRVGFECTVTVPHEDTTGFAILVKDDVEVMLQSEASVRADLATKSGPVTGRSTALFIEVDDLDAVQALVDPATIELPRRTTFYGMNEFGVREPGGHFVMFAQPTG